MLEKPSLPDEKIIDCLRDAYGLNIIEITFLPIGNDVNTAVYRAITEDGLPYFVKLRSGVFDEAIVAIPKLLHDQGVRQVIPPLETQTGQLWAGLDDFKVILAPFIDGHSGWAMTDDQWIGFGGALKALHTTFVPPDLKSRIPAETYSPRWREMVRGFQRQIEETTFADPIAAELAAYLKTKQPVVSYLVERAEHLGSILQTQTREFVLCHADIHANNILIDDQNGVLYMVDWDTVLLAPKERDLMFVGGRQFGDMRSPEGEKTFFYQGYGRTEMDPIALAYYTHERIVEDIAAYCEQIFLSNGGDLDREKGRRQLTGQFEPGGVIEMAYRSEKDLPPELRSHPA
jgi:spectinomycin phosphotransferase